MADGRAQAFVVPTGTQRRRVKTPSIMQMEAVECGAAALGMVLAYHGRWVPLEELRQVCGVSRDGARADNILRAAKSYGLDCKGRRVDLNKLAGLQLPAIAFWNFNHFVVIVGYGPEGVRLNDPAAGPRTVGWEEFDGSYTGLVLTAEPGAGFVRAGAPPSAVRGLVKRFQDGHSALVLCVLAGLGLMVPGLLVPAAVRVFVNDYLGDGTHSWLKLLVIGMATAAIAQLAFTWLQQTMLLRLSTKLSISMSTRFFRHVLRLPLNFFTQRQAGIIVARIGSNDQIASLLSSQLASNLLALLTSVFYLALMVVYDWELTLITVAFAVVNLGAQQLTLNRQRNLSRNIVQHTDRLSATTVSGIQNIETLKAASEDSSFFARWAGELATVTNATQALGVATAPLATLPMLLSATNTAVIIGFGGWQVMQGTLALGTWIAFQMLAAGFSAPVAQVIGFGATIQQTSAQLTALDDVLDYPLDETFAAPAAPPAPRADAGRRRRPLSGAFVLDGVSFGYDPLGQPLIKDLSLAVEPGQRVALVGATGSGKSTVARIVAGVNRPWSGRVLFDGVPREELDRDVLAASIAFVDQDIRLFEDSVRDNLTLWDTTISDDAVVRAAQDAAIHADVLRRPGGYERVVLDGGRDWSGGQRQRIEIARALAGNPALLIMDEATSALDPLVEHAVDRHIRARGCTCLIVAHRLSTIRDCDEIIVLRAGTPIERGTHDELLATGGVYAELIAG